jgi:hypothetical protein
MGQATPMAWHHVKLTAVEGGKGGLSCSLRDEHENDQVRPLCESLCNRDSHLWVTDGTEANTEAKCVASLTTELACADHERPHRAPLPNRSMAASFRLVLTSYAPRPNSTKPEAAAEVTQKPGHDGG